MTKMSIRCNAELDLHLNWKLNEKNNRNDKRQMSETLNVIHCSMNYLIYCTKTVPKILHFSPYKYIYQQSTVIYNYENIE